MEKSMAMGIRPEIGQICPEFGLVMEFVLENEI
jgi:hypothetical protein